MGFWWQECALKAQEAGTQHSNDLARWAQDFRCISRAQKSEVALFVMAWYYKFRFGCEGLFTMDCLISI